MASLNHLPLPGIAIIQAIPAAIGPLYDNPANTVAYIRGWRITNNSPTAVENVKLTIVPAAAGPTLGTPVLTPGAGINKVFDYDLKPNESATEEFPPDGYILATQHDSIQGLATDANTVVVSFFGPYQA